MCRSSGTSSSVPHSSTSVRMRRKIWLLTCLMLIVLLWEAHAGQRDGGWWQWSAVGAGDTTNNAGEGGCNPQLVAEHGRTQLHARGTQNWLLPPE
jgi:hypothetical protein